MTRRLALFAALVLALLASFILAGPPAQSAGENEIVVLATASNRGEVDPCG
jgi:hypothetical protein